MTSPLVSIVIPTYNRPTYLPTAIRCALQQTNVNVEILIVDDSDEPMSCQIDERIQYIRLDSRMPTGTKRNIGARIARGEIIANFDDDDFSHAHRLEDQVQRLFKSGKAVTGYCRTIRFDEATRTLYTGSNCPPYFVSGTSQCYLKSWWQKNPFPDCKYGEDSVFSRRARLADQLAAADPGKMMVVRTHSGNTEAIDIKRYKKLSAIDVSEEFFKAIDAPIKELSYMKQPHVCSTQCQTEIKEQIESLILGNDYKVNWLPEVIIR